MSNPSCGSRYPRDTVECGGAWVRAHLRTVAVILTVTGRLDADDVDPVAEHVARFVRLGAPLVVDVDGLHVADDAALERLLAILDAECHLQGVDWMPVGHGLAAASQVSFAASVPEALLHFVIAIHERRTLRLRTQPR